MARELYPGYDPKIDPLPITCWGYDFADESAARARRLERESVALWVWVTITKVRAKEKGPSHC